MNIINFYSTKDEYGFLSNFYKASIKINGKTYQTSEHYFQSQKFDDETYSEKVRNAKSPTEAANLGRSRYFPLRKDWELIKEDIMFIALITKFTQHPDLKEKLLQTGNAILVEHTDNDSYWGDGGDGSGKNRLGILLMRVRNELCQK